MFPSPPPSINIDTLYVTCRSLSYSRLYCHHVLCISYHMGISVILGILHSSYDRAQGDTEYSYEAVMTTHKGHSPEGTTPMC